MLHVVFALYERVLGIRSLAVVSPVLTSPFDPFKMGNTGPIRGFSNRPLKRDDSHTSSYAIIATVPYP